MRIPGTSRCILVLFLALSRGAAYRTAKVQNICCIASSLKVFGMDVWNGISKKILVWNENRMEKIASMEYGKIIFHSIPSPAIRIKFITF